MKNKIYYPILWSGCSVFLTTASSSALTPFEDHFNLTKLNLTRWQLGQDSTNNFVQKNGKLHFKLPRKSSDFSDLILKNNQPGYNEDWEITLDVNNKIDFGEYASSIGFKVFNADDPSDKVYYEFCGKRAEDGGFIAYFNEDGIYPDYGAISNNPKTTAGSIRLQFSKKSKIITLWYESNGPSDGVYEWKKLATYSVNGKGGEYRGNWKMNKGSGRFGIAIRTWCEFDVPLGYLSCDNFVLKFSK